MPGQSGNPGGRPQDTERVRLLAQTHTEEAIQTLVAIMRNTKCRDTARVSAAEAILNRGWGKPEQAVAVTNPVGGLFEIVVTHASH